MRLCLITPAAPGSRSGNRVTANRWSRILRQLGHRVHVLTAWNDTPEDRVVLLMQFTRPMRPLGRLVNNAFLTLVKMTAYYKEPKRNMEKFEDRFQAAVRRAESFQIKD